MEKIMGRLLSRMLVPLMLLTVVGACGPRPVAGLPPGLPWQPGRYVQESSVTPDFDPEEAPYSLAAFPVEQAAGAPAESFQAIFQEELLRAWQAQGLKVGTRKNAVRLSGTVHNLSLRGARLRWLTGRLYASLTMSGLLTKGDGVVFAFRDQVAVSSPLAPGKAAPREQELLLRSLAREAARHILNELLLHRSPSDSG